MAIKLGDLCKDVITGFSGVCDSRHEYLNGCVRIGIQSREMKDGKPVPAQVFDEPQVVATNGSIFTEMNSPDKPRGGPHDDPQREAAPAR